MRIFSGQEGDSGSFASPPVVQANAVCQSSRNLVSQTNLFTRLPPFSGGRRLPPPCSLLDKERARFARFPPPYEGEGSIRSFSPSLRRRGFGGGCFPAGYGLFNAGQDSFEILNDLQVREPKDLDPEALQVGRALPVILHRFWGEVRVPIDLDRELRPWRVEVEDVGIDAVLPAEPRAELPASEVVPEPAFGVCRVVPQGFAFADLAAPVEVLGQNSTSP